MTETKTTIQYGVAVNTETRVLFNDIQTAIEFAATMHNKHLRDRVAVVIVETQTIVKTMELTVF